MFLSKLPPFPLPTLVCWLAHGTSCKALKWIETSELRHHKSVVRTCWKAHALSFPTLPGTRKLFLKKYQSVHSDDVVPRYGHCPTSFTSNWVSFSNFRVTFSFPQRFNCMSTPTTWGVQWQRQLLLLFAYWTSVKKDPWPSNWSLIRPLWHQSMSIHHWWTWRACALIPAPNC